MFSFLSPSGASGIDPKRAIVRCVDDYERATQRVSELGSPPPGTPEEMELIGLIEAIEKWEARHDDEEGWC
ncbi:hypothetical protein [Bosea beijingensis]|uniref:hypothetical protein n=1 Tax=Bosea beijingensis TaxID=3068632 RepID=UPI0027423888|nr:hypothetical protein [Bosea sp. REN20]